VFVDASAFSILWKVEASYNRTNHHQYSTGFMVVLRTPFLHLLPVLESVKPIDSLTHHNALLRACEETYKVILLRLLIF